MPLRHVKPGDPLVISASTYNAFVDAAIAHRHQQHALATEALTGQRQTSIVLVRNDTATARERYDIVGLGGLIITPADNADTFADRIAMKGVALESSHAGRFGVLLEPLRAGQLGRAVVDGVTVARVQMRSETHRYADAKPGEHGRLESRVSGSAVLLWVQSPESRDPEEPELAWCVAKLGVAGGGAATTTFAQITSRAGATPPYRYSAARATMSESGAWTLVTDGEAYDPVFNIEEQGSGGQWVNPLLVGDIVALYPAPDDVAAYVCTRSHYRGTY